MMFIAFGVNHETAPVRVREQVAMNEAHLRSVYRRAVAERIECVIVATCNRTEVYLVGDAHNAARIRQLIAEETQAEWPSEHGFNLKDEEAVRHVLGVVMGLNSLVLGDAQIFSQVKQAYQFAVDEQAVGTVLHRLMHTAFRGAKRVIAETQLTSGNASVSGAAVAIARDFYFRRGEELADKRALVLGAGQMGRLAVEALRSAGVDSVQVTNRTADRARHTAATYGAAVVAWEERHAAVDHADVVVVATGSSTPILLGSKLNHRARPAVVFDISVPRNVDPEIRSLEGYHLVDLDVLNEMLVKSERVRKESVPAAEAIRAELLDEFVAWVFHYQAMNPAVSAIASAFEQIRRQEIDKHAHRFSETDREELDELTRSIMQKLLAIPIVRLKSTSPESINFTKGIELLHYLFSRIGCDDAEAASDDLASILAADSSAHTKAPEYLAGHVADPPSDNFVDPSLVK